MTARDDLYAVLVYGGAATGALARGLLDAYRDEVLREAAAKIRDAEAHREGGEWLDTASGLLDAADLIDPDKES